jgi:hypothetical protein
VKLSEAMMLGISAFNLRPQVWACPDGGCLLGVAAHAAGIKFASSGEAIARIRIQWPWIDRKFDVPQLARDLPKLRDGNFLHIADKPSGGAVYIISFFANHVKLGTCSIEQVVDWVRSVEPAEEVAIEATMETPADAVVHQVR